MMTKCIVSAESGKHNQPSPSDKLSTCAACSSDIFDRYYLLVAGKSWHSNCLQCCVCGIKLESEFSCFLRNNLVFCRDDYNRHFPRHCYRCNKLISPNEMVMRVKRYVFHMSCFCCVVCANRLQPGDYFGVSSDGTLFCRSHCIVPHHQMPPTMENGDKVCGSGGNGVANLEQQLSMPTPIVAAPLPEHGPSPVATSSFGNVSLLNIEDNVCRMNFGRGDHEDDSTLSFNSGHFTTDQHASIGECTETMELGHHQPVFETGGANTPCPSSISPAPSTLHNISPGGSLDGCGGGHSAALDGGGTIVGHQRSGGGNSDMLSMMMMNGAGANAATASSMSRSKRMRTSFKHNQLRIMKHYFTLNANPDAKVLKELAQKTGLTKRVLQVWFQNARAKNRRSQQIRQDLMANMGSVQNSSHSEMSPTSTASGANERRTPASGSGTKPAFLKDDHRPSLHCRTSASGRFNDDVDDDGVFPNDGSSCDVACVKPLSYAHDDEHAGRYMTVGYGAIDELENNGCGRFPRLNGGVVVGGSGNDVSDAALSRVLKNERQLNNGDENASSTNYATLAACLRHLKRSDSPLPPAYMNDDNALLVIKSGQQSDLPKSSDKEFYNYNDGNGDF